MKNHLEGTVNGGGGRVGLGMWKFREIIMCSVTEINIVKWQTNNLQSAYRKRIPRLCSIHLLNIQENEGGWEIFPNLHIYNCR